MVDSRTDKVSKVSDGDLEFYPESAQYVNFGVDKVVIFGRDPLTHVDSFIITWKKGDHAVIKI